MNWKEYKKWLKENVVIHEQTRRLDESKGLNMEEWVFGYRWSVRRLAEAKYTLASDTWDLGNALGIFLDSSKLPEWEEEKSWAELFPPETKINFGWKERNGAIWADLQKLYDEYWLTEEDRAEAWKREVSELKENFKEEVGKIIIGFFHQETVTNWQNCYPKLMEDFELLGSENQKTFAGEKREITNKRNFIFEGKGKEKKQEIKQEIKITAFLSGMVGTTVIFFLFFAIKKIRAKLGKTKKRK